MFVFYRYLLCSKVLAEESYGSADPHRLRWHIEEVPTFATGHIGHSELMSNSELIGTTVLIPNTKYVA